MSIKAQVNNLEPLLAGLRNFAATIKQPITRAAIGTGESILALAQGTVRVRTGYLRSNLQTWVIGDKVYVGTDVDYARFLEYGTRKMSAYPFLLPSTRANSSTFIEASYREVSRHLSENIPRG